MKIKIKNKSVKGILRLPCIALDGGEADLIFDISGLRFPGGRASDQKQESRAVFSAMRALSASSTITIAFHRVTWDEPIPSPTDNRMDDEAEEEVVIVEEKKGTLDLLVTFAPSLFNEATSKNCHHVHTLLSHIHPLPPSASSLSSLPSSGAFDHIPMLFPPSSLPPPRPGGQTRRDVRDEVFEMVQQSGSSSWTHEIINPKGLKAKLFHYQARAVSWMCHREEGEIKQARSLLDDNQASTSSSLTLPSSASNEPPARYRDSMVLQGIIWRRAVLSRVDEETGAAKDADVFFNTIDGRAILAPPPLPTLPNIVKGGLLCEEM